MAKKKTEVVEETIEQPKVDDTVEKIKVKKKQGRDGKKQLKRYNIV